LQHIAVLTDYNLGAFRSFHRRCGGPLSMALFRTGVPQQCGIAELDAQDRVVAFTEKPALPRSNLANAGLYVASPDILPLIPELPVADIGYHLLPRLVGQMHGWHPEGFLMDIGTPENLQQAGRLWQERLKLVQKT
jgi:mannose-1-phosphate guanylyltransferase